MPEFKEYKPGTFCWIDLATTDAESAKKFYSDLFGWETADEQVAPNVVYTRLSQGGNSVGALYEMGKEMREMKIPPMWMSYVSVENADRTAAKAKQLGATMNSAPFDVTDAGRMGVIQDPTGAYFSIWQPMKHHGADICNEPVSLCWNELMTNDVDRAGAFYTELFGYTVETQRMGDFDYTSFMNGGRPAAGMMAIRPDMGEGIPPHWAIYLAVEDCDATAAKAESLGGRVIAPASDIPEVGRFAIIADPQGAVFGIVALLNPLT
jgi:predicted enzyme related to lactoylglutathione lyase